MYVYVTERDRDSALIPSGHAPSQLALCNKDRSTRRHRMLSTKECTISRATMLRLLLDTGRSARVLPLINLRDFLHPAASPSARSVWTDPPSKDEKTTSFYDVTVEEVRRACHPLSLSRIFKPSPAVSRHLTSSSPLPHCSMPKNPSPSSACITCFKLAGTPGSTRARS